MDTMFSVGDLVAVTGATPPTIRAASRSAGQRTPGGHRRFSDDEAADIVSAVGITPRVDGLTPGEVRVLAALARSPKGLRSNRAVARRAGVSPTTAGEALRSLARQGLARSTTMQIAAGRVIDVTMWTLHISDRWLEIAPTVLRTRPPARIENSSKEGSVTRVPRRFWHLFWSGDPSRISLPEDAAFVARRMLGSQDAEAVAWAASNLPPEALRSASRARGWPAATRALALNAAGDDRT